jgi:hypothetical protein
MQREAQGSAQHTELLLELELGMIVDAHGNSLWRVASHSPFWPRPGDFADLLDKRRPTPK